MGSVSMMLPAVTPVATFGFGFMGNGFACSDGLGGPPLPGVTHLPPSWCRAGLILVLLLLFLVLMILEGLVIEGNNSLLICASFGTVEKPTWNQCCKNKVDDDKIL